MWHVSHDMWHVTRDIWHMTHDTWHATCDMWHLTFYTWNLTFYTWHVTQDIWDVTLPGIWSTFFCWNQRFSQGVAVYSCLVFRPYAILPGLSLVMWTVLADVRPGNLSTQFYLGQFFLASKKNWATNIWQLKYVSQKYLTWENKLSADKFSAENSFQNIFTSQKKCQPIKFVAHDGLRY